MPRNQDNKRTYRSWRSMLERCYDTHRRDFRKWGGKGITVCDRWLFSFPNFVSDMGIRPVGTSLDRIDGKRRYEPSNCRWATPQEQATNRVNAWPPITYMGKTMHYSYWAPIVGLPKYILCNRLRDGWDPALALTTPVIKRSKKIA